MAFQAHFLPVTLKISTCKFLHQSIKSLGLSRQSKAFQEESQAGDKVFVFEIHLIHVGMHMTWHENSWMLHTYRSISGSYLERPRPFDDFKFPMLIIIWMELDDCFQGKQLKSFQGPPFDSWTFGSSATGSDLMCWSVGRDGVGHALSSS